MATESTIVPPVNPDKLNDSVVEPLAEILAGLEEGYELLGHRDCRARPRVAADARRTVLDGERAESPEPDPVATRKSIDDFSEDDFDDALDVAVMKLLIRRHDVWISSDLIMLAPLTNGTVGIPLSFTHRAKWKGRPSSHNPARRSWLIAGNLVQRRKCRSDAPVQTCPNRRKHQDVSRLTFQSTILSPFGMLH